MSTLKTHNLQSPDAASVNIALAPNNGMVVAGISTFNNRVLIGTNIEGHADADDLTIGSSTNTAGITIRTNTSGTGRLWFSDGTSGAAEYQGYVQYDHNNQRLSLGSGGTTKLHITSSGKLLIGHSSSTLVGVGNTYSMPLQVIGNSYDTAGIVAARYAADANGPTMHFVKSRNATKGSQTIVQVDDTLGFIRWYGSDGTDTTNAAAMIAGYCDATPASDKIPGRLSFWTTDTLTYPRERLRITSTGILVTGNGTAPNSTDVGSIFMPGGGDLGWLTSSGSITFNAYYNGGWKYVTSGTSHILWASSEGFNFSTASSGSADGTISYSRAMKIFTNNRVSIGDGNSGTPLAALHINTKSTMGTDTALWIGDNANNRYMAIQQNASSEQFSHMDLVYNDNASRSMINLKNPYAPAGYGAAITWKGYNNGDQGYIECKSEGANSANATMYLNSTNGTFLQGNSNRHVTMPQQPSFAAYQAQSVWTVSGTMVFNSTRHNVGNHYSTSNGHFTAPVAGSYQFNFYSIYRGNHTSAWVSLYKNNSRMMGGDTHFTSPSLGQDWHNVSFSQVLYLNANDYVEMKSAQSTDWHGNHWQCFSGYLLG